MAFSGPIPGQSLTLEPKGFPWERPPEIADPEEALQWEIKRLSEPKVLGGLIDAIDIYDLDVNTLTKGIARAGVAKGLYTIDVAMLIAPVVHEFIKQAAISAGANPDDGFEDKTANEEAKRARQVDIAKKMMKNMKLKPKEAAKEAITVQEPVAAPEAVPSKGLMARGGM